MNREKEKQKVIEKAKKWVNERINLEDVGAHHILIEKGNVLFWKFRVDPTKHEIMLITNYSKEVKEAWYCQQPDYSTKLRINYNDGTFEEIPHKEVLKKEWFHVSLKKMGSKGLINPRMGTFTFARYNIVFQYHSRIDFDILESSTLTSYEFERNFKKPRNKRVYATVTI